METREIQKLIDFIAQSGLDEVNIETTDLKIKVKRYGSAPTASVTSASPVSAAPSIATPAPTAPVTQSAPAEPVIASGSAASSNLVTIKSPMIGTFYRASNPETPVFINVGDEIKPGKVVCVIEAMKLFNEIESEISGRIVKVLVENATPVEFDQPLFLVEPA
ncbi:acetyl-CoA carboxylase biotin carboxyl carrier protein [Dyadobacter sediminis]|uniref:Biotin carboxyl carrier protein of acetyl-CoA carboxylase n=1 Tax=Dyadobacter sediminis TaxID=1493691 RepID=A0A5R9K6U9_9BACT|nr:acetyl-CoA carboxylase biotin carboxyl carrier protein [Dyadobacter sediminis]TLU89507.1 acetyl-CoA carboxylase biotin carboxyl carrier protein [Dyadobacter sediminis]GGC04837.1 acetyl-CoA carboxylase, biotin carboxyl carrier protein [Dyadobacter sediminis]